MLLKDRSNDPLNSAKSTIEIKTRSEIEKLRQAGQMVTGVLRRLCENVVPGITTKSLDDMASKEIGSLGAKPAFLGYRGFPATICVSLNNELVHGIPRNNKVVKEGDIVSIDIGLINKDFYGDTAITVGVGKISDKAKKLLDVTKRSLDIAIEQVKPGKRMGDVSWSIQQYVESQGFSVVRDYVGHGIGRKLHEDPPVPNFGQANTGLRLIPGMVFAIEPMVNIGTHKVKVLEDGWTVVTEDDNLCAHFEHMVVVTEKGCEVLTR